MKKIFMMVIFFVIVLFVMGCTDAMVASKNISKAADQFEIFRRVVFYNGITGDYILTVEGYCSISVDSDGDLAITIKTAPGEYLKHYLHLSDNVTYFSEQIQPAKVSDSHYRVIFKPSVIIPSIDLE